MHLDGGDVLQARTIILACGVSWRRLPIEGFDRLVGKGISYGAARSEASNTHGLDIHIVGAGNSAGQAALFFSNYARSVTILCRGDRLEKSMSQLPGRPARDALEHQRAVRRRSWSRRHGDDVARGDRRPERSDGRDEPARRPAGCSSSSARTRETAWLPPEIALDRHGYVLTGPDVPRRSTGSSTAIPTCSRRACRASSPAATSASSPVKRVAAAVGEGSMAIAFVHQYLKDVRS